MSTAAALHAIQSKLKNFMQFHQILQTKNASLWIKNIGVVIILSKNL